MISDDDLLRMASRIARRYRVDGMTYDDLVQEAFIAGFTARDRPPSHAYTFMRQRLSHLVRSSQSRTVEFLGALPDSESKSLLPLDVAIFNEELARFFGRLSPGERAVIESQDQSDSHLAAKLGVSLSALHNVRHKVLKKFKRENNI